MTSEADTHPGFSLEIVDDTATGGVRITAKFRPVAIEDINAELPLSSIIGQLVLKYIDTLGKTRTLS